MRNLINYLEKNKIYLTHKIISTFGQIFEKYKFQQIAIIGEDASTFANSLSKDFRTTTVNIPKELCYSLCGMNIARAQLKEDTRLIIAYGSQHSLNLVKLVAQKMGIAYCYVANETLSTYSLCTWAILDNKAVHIESEMKATIVDEMNFEYSANTYAQLISQIFGCFEVYLRGKFFEETSKLDIKYLLNIYSEILNIQDLSSPESAKFLLILNLLIMVKYAQDDDEPFHDNYYLTLRFLSKNIKLFAEFDKISFVFAEMLSILYEMYFKNDLQSPLFMNSDALSKKINFNEYAKALASVPARCVEKNKYILQVYLHIIIQMINSFQKVYKKASFELKNLILDSGYNLFASLDCDNMIDIIKETSLLNEKSLLCKFGVTELY